MNFVVRTITAEELPKLDPLFKADDHGRLARKRAKRIRRGDDDVYVVEDEGRFIAEVTVVYRNDEYADYTIPHKRVYMEALRVLPEHQGKGVGQYLLHQVICSVKAQGYTEITIGVEDENRNAKHIYEKLGFTEFLRRDHGGEYEPCDYNVYLKRL